LEAIETSVFAGGTQILFEALSEKSEYFSNITYTRTVVVSGLDAPLRGIMSFSERAISLAMGTTK
jgi:hypothetical protein